MQYMYLIKVDSPSRLHCPPTQIHTYNNDLTLTNIMMIFFSSNITITLHVTRVNNDFCHI